MQKKLVIVLAVLLTVQAGFTQVNPDYKSNKKQELEYKILKSDYTDTINHKQEIKNRKNPAISLILSLLVPGTGHLYAGRMDVGKYFITSEAACWLGVIGLDLYGNALRDDSRTYASEHSGLSKEGKDDDYFSNVGNFNSIYDYNNEKLAMGQWEKLYDINTHFWSWDSEASKNIFDKQRKKSERTYNARIIFATGLVVNRIVSAISALILTNKQNNVLSGISFSSDFISSQKSPYDGIRLNFVKSF